MSSPGGPGNPENGEPWGGRGSWGAQPGQQGGPPYQGGMRYQGFGTFDRPQEPTAPPPVAPLPPPPPPSPPRRNRGPLIALCAAVAVVLVVVVTAVVFGGSGGDDDARAGSAPAPTSAAPETSAATAPGTSAPTSAGPPPEPLEPGWQAVPVPKRNAAYDVPPGWELQSPGSLVGFGETEDDPVTVSGVALYQHGYCPDRSGSFRGLAGATARRGPDAAAIATDMARRFSELAYGADARIELTPPQPAVLPGGLPGHKVVATVFPAPAACGSPSAVVNVLTTDGSGGTAVVHVAAADQEVPDAVTPDVLDRITASVRPAG
ncbi:hypothetical protein ABZ805_07980 [Saccharopolyspora sp. NPDC047091]|uniref:hypothetical protein n=1 Tax=Saccharopolyspora sp. NPDC047091 TaxID=3155924 RepID=UPI0033F313CF